MKKKIHRLPVLLIVLLTVAMTVALCIHTFLPEAVLPKLDIPAMVLLTLLALLAEHFTVKNVRHDYICLALYGALAFSLLPIAAGFISASMWWKYALVGGSIVPAVTALFTGLTQRLLSGPTAKAAPVIGAICLWLASQCFSGMLL